jgi:hypothetical protein
MKNITMDNLTVNGSLNFFNLTIKDKLQVNGSAGGKTLICNTIKINGSLNGENITINGEAKINGGLSVLNSSLQDIKISSNNIVLNNSKANNIIINKQSDKNKVQKLLLKGKTIIYGNIIFESNNGEIYLDSAAEINGKITGGNIIKN